ncbi:amino acid ABC transporter permease [Nitratireductor pacificus]|uniref:Amino acid ABC transporter permease n=1 Tax=Nitratireductor pacificus pht-3B TaxID=391937 RepID=K2LKN1_9HYPH|nr:amino acid ABC transporter permease [Nitratireductor pacificus]EKF18304.1 amino acid ABC transporter permease [Nitratireductor pacificus pht-3B]
MTFLEPVADWIVGVYNFRIVALYADEFARGITNTLLAAGASLALSLILGTLLAALRLSSNRLLSALAEIYIQVIRSTPLLLQIYIVYFALPLLVPATARWPELWIGILALTLHTAPYMAEIIRSGIQSVARGQIEGALAVGMTFRQRAQHIVLPQAFANIMPALLGQTAILVKDTSLLSLITVFDLVAAGMLLNSERIKPNEGFLSVAVIYFAIYLLLLLASRFVERKLAGPAWNKATA